MRRSIITTAMAIMAILILGSAAFARGPSPKGEKVSGDTSDGYAQEGWLFNRDPGNVTPIDFNFEQASIGGGSLYVEPIENSLSGDEKFIGENFLLTPMSDVESISYDFYLGDGAETSDANEYYMNVYANPDGEVHWGTCRYNVVPDSADEGVWNTVTFDPNEDYSVSGPCPASPSDLNDDALVFMFSLNLGDTSSSDEGLDGYFDNVVVDTVDGTTTYDFEVDPDDCKKGGHADFGFKNQGKCISAIKKNDHARK